jgi:hypothetical protein
LLSRHAGPEPAGQSEGRILVETENIAERVQNRLRTVVPGEKLLYGNIASGFHRFPDAERAKNEPEPPDVKPASPPSFHFGATETGNRIGSGVCRNPNGILIIQPKVVPQALPWVNVPQMNVPMQG